MNYLPDTSVEVSGYRRLGYDNHQTQIWIINVETTLETHLGSFTIRISSTVSWQSDGEELKLRGEKKSGARRRLFYFYLFFSIAISLYNEGQPSSQLSYAFLFRAGFTASLNNL